MTTFGSRTRWLLLATGAGLVAIAIIAWLPTRSDAPPERPATPSDSVLTIGFGGLVRIHGRTNEVGGWIPLSGVSGLAVDRDAIWTMSGQDNFETATRIDPVSGKILSTIRLTPLRASTPRGIAIGSKAVWVISADTVYRIDPATNEVTQLSTFAPGSSLSSIAVGAGAVWVTDPTSQAVYRIDPKTNETTSRIRVPHPAGVAIGSGSIWVSSTDGEIFRIDASRDEVVDRFAVPGASFGLSAGSDGVWAANSSNGSVEWIDPSNGSRKEIRVGRAPTDVKLSGGRVWVSNSEDGTVSVIDPVRHAVVTTIDVGPRPYLLAASDGGVWVAILGRATSAAHG